MAGCSDAAAMKINILSDLHLSRGGLPPPAGEADVVILAGDIARPPQALAWAAQIGRPTLYVAGNHEFYASSLAATARALKEASAGTCVRVLDDEEIVIGGVRFLGSTLWTDFRLLGDGEASANAQSAAQGFMHDFSRIFVDDAMQQALSPRDTQRLFERHAAWLDDRLAQPHDGPTVVITHHAPSPSSVHPRFAGSPINAAFVSNLEALMGADRVQLWVHGHTHDSFDYRIKGTRVVCNPRGYARDGVNENPHFDPGFTVELG
jgi:predicted phosphodiesterase